MSTNVTSEFALTTEKEFELAKIMLVERPSVGNTFESVFNLKFGAYEEGDASITLLGKEGSISIAKKALIMMVGALTEGQYIGDGLIKKFSKALSEAKHGTKAIPAAAQNHVTKLPAAKNHLTGDTFVPKTENQRLFAELIDKNTLSFGFGPAGTGKTHVAVKKAIQALKAGTVEKIVIARPAIEAADSLGFLPGDKFQKLEEYMKPIYAELDKAFGRGKYKKMIEDGILEVESVGHMRGTTWEKAFVIVDEAQNLRHKQVYLTLTRVGEGSKLVMTGDPDPNQIDLPKSSDSGLAWAAENLNGSPNVGVMRFTEGDVMRSEIVKVVVGKLGDFFNKQAQKEKEEKAKPAAANQNWRKKQTRGHNAGARR